MKKNTIVQDTLILTIITLIAGFLLGVVYQVTKDPIAKQEEEAKTKAYQAVFSEADSFETVVEAEDEDLAAYLAENGFDSKYGARPLKRYIQKYVETLAAKMILADQVEEGDTIVITVEGDKLSAKCEKGSKNK